MFAFAEMITKRVPLQVVSAIITGGLIVAVLTMTPGLGGDIYAILESFHSKLHAF